MISFSYQKIPQHHPHHHKRLIHGGCWKGKELKHKQQNRLLDQIKKHNKRNDISVYRPSRNNIKRWGLSAERREKSSLKIKTAKLTNHSPTKTEVGHKTKNNNNSLKSTCSKLILYRSGEEAAQSRSQDQLSYVISLPILQIYVCFRPRFQPKKITKYIPYTNKA